MNFGTSAVASKDVGETKHNSNGVDTRHMCLFLPAGLKRLKHIFRGTDDGDVDDNDVDDEFAFNVSFKGISFILRAVDRS